MLADRIGRLMVTYQDRLVRLGAAGDLLGYSAPIPYPRVTREALWKKSTSAACLRSGPAGKLRSQLAQMGLAHPSDALSFALFGESCLDLSRHQSLVVCS
ncbi:MAG: hypothetical protein M0Z53_16520 [Thermaerobacter sp.]|nr:hypothetical protein [Thermaerobacter sp.]